MYHGLVELLSISTLAYLAVVGVMLVFVRRRTPRGIVRRLRSGTPAVRVRVGFLGWGAPWNPARPYSYAGLLYGRGVAIYSLHDGQVRVDWRPRRGDARQFVGPIPPGVTAPPPKQSAPWGRAIITYILVLAGVGLIAGLSSGSLAVGLAGVSVAICLLPGVAALLRSRAASHKSRSTLRLVDGDAPRTFP